MKRQWLMLLAAVAASSVLQAGGLEETITMCDDCHGKNGVSQHDDMPTIAGYSATTISDMLLAYVDKTRPAAKSKFRHGDTTRAETDMIAIATELSEEEIEQLAEHYAELPFVPAQQSFDAAKAAAGETLHEERCVKCHDEGGQSPDDDSAILAGQWTPYLQKAFDNYLNGSRQTDEEMLKALEKLSAEQIDQLLNFYASQLERDE